MTQSRWLKLAAAVALSLGIGAGTAGAAGPKIVPGPSSDPQCFKPWSDQTKFFQWPAKPAPYRLASTALLATSGAFR
jgi:ribose transport system substrate-binding protein